MHPISQSLKERPESELIEAARSGDIDAMWELFQRHYPISVAVARRILPAQEEYLDAVQSAYLSAFRNFNTYRGEASFRTWITRIVMNHCLMHLRYESRHRRVVRLDSPVADGITPAVVSRAPNPEEITQRAEFGKAVVIAMARLPKLQLEVFNLCVVSGHSIRDAAEALGLSEPATKTRLFRARLRMRRHLNGVWPIDRATRVNSSVVRFQAESGPERAAA